MASTAMHRLIILAALAGAVCGFKVFPRDAPPAAGAAPIVTTPDEVSRVEMRAETPAVHNGSRELATISGCTATTNRPMTCSDSTSSGAWSYMSCGPSLDSSGSLYAVLRNPGRNAADLQWFGQSTAYSSRDPLPGLCSYSTLGGTLQGTCSSGSVTSATINVKNTYYSLFPVTRIMFGCYGTGRVYVDFWVGKSASGYPSNPNPSGRTSCSSYLSDAVGSTSQSAIPICINADTGYTTTVTNMNRGGSLSITLENPVGHKLGVWISSGTASCGSANFPPPSILASEGSLTSPTTSTYITASTDACGTSCCVSIGCLNPSNWGVCGTITASLYVTNGPYVCSSGSYNSNGGPSSSSCASCGTGVATCTGASSPSSCKPGYALGERACTQCGTGTYSAGNTASTCTQCAAGLTSPAGSSSITACVYDCPAGLYNANGGSTSASCAACGAGVTTCTSASSASTCSPGHALSLGACTKCGNGTYSAGYTASSCTQCALGFTSPAASTSAAACVSCGTGVATCTSTSSASACSPGYSLSSGACTQCSAGSYSAGGASSCTQCASGFSSLVGATSAAACVALPTCPASAYLSGITCAACPSGTTSPIGSTSLSACVTVVQFSYGVVNVPVALASSPSAINALATSISSTLFVSTSSSSVIVTLLRIANAADATIWPTSRRALAGMEGAVGRGAGISELHALGAIGAAARFLQICASNQYYNGAACASCPTGQTSPMGSTGLAACVTATPSTTTFTLTFAAAGPASATTAFVTASSPSLVAAVVAAAAPLQGATPAISASILCSSATSSTCTAAVAPPTAPAAPATASTLPPLGIAVGGAIGGAVVVAAIVTALYVMKAGCFAAPKGIVPATLNLNVPVGNAYGSAIPVAVAVHVPGKTAV
jgi:hypothetical protein